MKKLFIIGMLYAAFSKNVHASTTEITGQETTNLFIQTKELKEQELLGLLLEAQKHINESEISSELQSDLQQIETALEGHRKIINTFKKIVEALSPKPSVKK